jgi:hypothetical protein
MSRTKLKGYLDKEQKEMEEDEKVDKLLLRSL